MTDFEIIKKDIAYNCDTDCEYCEDLCFAYKSATRMVARIEELEKRPKVIRCGQCSYWNKPPIDNPDDEPGYCNYFKHHMDEDQFCSIGTDQPLQDNNW